MNLSDPIADMLTRLRNGSMARHEFVLVPASKLKTNIARILRDEGFVKEFQMLQDGPQGTLKIFLNYVDRRSAAIQRLAPCEQTRPACIRWQGRDPTGVRRLGYCHSVLHLRV